MKYRKGCDCKSLGGRIAMVYEEGALPACKTKGKIVVCSVCGTRWSTVEETGTIRARNVEIREIGGQ